MFSMKLLLTFSLLTGVVAEECTLGDLGVGDFSDTVTVSNVSESADAFVAVEFNHGQSTMYVRAGETGTAVGLAATRFTAKVTDPSNGEYEGYRARLLELRDQLERMTMSPQGATVDDVASAYAELALVQSTLDQMKGSSKVQSCSGKIKTDVPSQVTLKWARTSDGAALWVLDCG